MTVLSDQAVAQALHFRVHGKGGRLMAGTAYAEDAAAMVALLGDGATIRVLGYVAWTEGQDGQAGESYDAVAEHIANLGF